MGPELNLKPKLEASEKASSICKENPSLTQNKGKSLDTEPSLVKPFLEPDRTQNVETNINEATVFSEVGMGESDKAETTEASSSFSDTESATDYGFFEGDEAESGLRFERNPMPDFDGYHNTFRTRNKKLTNHWRSFVRPLMWRCKWMELRMKELELQALQYDKELAEYDEESQSRMNKLMKRHKRKRVEETVDTKSYMSQHNFFSYYENKKFISDGDALEDDTGNQGTKTNNSEVGSSEGFSLESRDEQSYFEDLFRNIETVQSQVRKLITRVDVVVYTHTEKINSIKRLSNAITQNALGNTAQNPNVPSGCRDDLNTETVHFASQNTCGENTGDEFIRDRSVPSCLQVNGTGKRLQTEDVLIDNELAKEELQDFEKFRHQFGGKSLMSKERKENPTSVPETDSLPSKALSVRGKGKKRKRKMGSRR